MCLRAHLALSAASGGYYREMFLEHHSLSATPLEAGIKLFHIIPYRKMQSIDERIGSFTKFAVLRSFITLFNFGTSLYSTLNSWMDRLVEVFQVLTEPIHYVFFEGNVTPYLLRKVNTWASGSAAPELLYSADSKIFVPWLPGQTTDEILSQLLADSKLKCLPILSLEIVNEVEEVVYDLTDFLESVRYMEVDGLPQPTLFHILAAWSISSHVVPNYSKYIVRYIDMNGDVKTMAPELSGESEVVESASEGSSAFEADTTPVVEPTSSAALAPETAEATPEAADSAALVPEAAALVPEAAAPVLEATPEAPDSAAPASQT